MKKREGKLEIFTSFFVFLLLAIVLIYRFQISSFHATKIYVEDAMAASNLASAVIDIQEYGISHNIVISDTEQAYVYYLNALQENLNLNQNWEHPNRAIISGRVKVEEYRIYNVIEDDVEVHIFTPNGRSSAKYADALGAIRAPNGKLIENTSIYSRISFPVNASWGVQVNAQKENLVDIATR